MNTLSNDQCCICGSNQLVTVIDSGEIVCECCGAVISDRTVEKGPECSVTSTAGKGDDQNRTGMSFSLARSDMGLSTVIGRTNKDARGSKINSSMLSRLRTWDSRTQVYTSTDKNLTQAFTQLIH
jgi:transcription initiation factor TFIIB